MSFYGVGETYRDEFNTYDNTNVLANADATPTGILVVNGTDIIGTTVTITNPSTGRYKLSVSLAGLAFGDDFWVYVTATVGGLTQGRKFPTYRILSPGPISISDGMAQAGAASTITLAADTAGGSNAYVDRKITIVAGTGIDQSRWITAYNNTTAVVTVHRPWDTVPDATSEYVIESTSAANTTAINGDFEASAKLSAEMLATIGGSVVDPGGTATTTSFAGDTGLSAANGYYSTPNSVLTFYTGVNKGKAARITGYTGAGRTFTFAAGFPAAPANNDKFIILGLIG